MDFILDIYKNEEGDVLTDLSKDKEIMTFTMVTPGNIYLLRDHEWVLVDTMSLPKKRPYKNYIDKSSTDLIYVNTQFPLDGERYKIKPSEEEVLSSTIYNYYMNEDMDISYKYKNGELYKYNKGILVIEFYNENDKYGEFSNYYGKGQNKKFKLEYKGKSWPTTEHLFQAFKFLGPNSSEIDNEYAEIIRQQTTPNKAKIIANQKRGGGYKWRTDLNIIIDKYKNLGVKIRKNWDDIKFDIMLKILRLKFTQNPSLKKLLLGTGESILIEHTKRDKIWGDGGDGSGMNLLGKALMKIRDEL